MSERAEDDRGKGKDNNSAARQIERKFRDERTPTFWYDHKT